LGPEEGALLNTATISLSMRTLLHGVKEVFLLTVFCEHGEEEKNGHFGEFLLFYKDYDAWR
jgi:hypothetical protein